MSADLAWQLGLLVGEGLFIVLALLLLFRLRGLFGLVPVYVTAAILYQLANLTAGSVFIRLGDDLALSPGSVVIFPGILVVVLLVYVREDAQEARKLIYGLLAGDFMVAALGLLIAQHFRGPLILNPLGLTPDLFIQQPRILVVGTLALFVDTVLIILGYELVSRVLPRWLFLRVAITLVVVLLIDTLLFVTGAFVESPAYLSILASAAVGKAMAGLLYAVPVTLYLRLGDGDTRPGPVSLGGLFDQLTYRQKYEALRSEMTRDRLTGVYNRAYFDDASQILIAGAERTGRPLTVLMIDIDNFKQINDTHGHRVGDRVLHLVAAAMRESCRTSDLVCRYGGEEFAVLLPNADLAEGIEIARRIGPAVTHAVAREAGQWGGRPATVTIGAASFPREGATAAEVIQLADHRLYQGKAAGRNCVVPAMSVGDSSQS